MYAGSYLNRRVTTAFMTPCHLSRSDMFESSDLSRLQSNLTILRPVLKSIPASYQSFLPLRAELLALHMTKEKSQTNNSLFLH